MKIKNPLPRLFLRGVCAMNCRAMMCALPALTGVSLAIAAPDVTGTNVQSFEVKGVVKKLQREGQTLVVAHEAIAAYMDAMTMPFRVRDAQELKVLQPEDQIAFQLHVTEQESWIDHVVRLSSAATSHSKPAAPEAAQAQPAPPRHPLLDYRFTNQLGQAVRLADFHGQAMAITFFFTRCPIPDYCPRLARNFEEASHKLLTLPNAPTNCQFLSFSFDTDYDTPARLKAYGERYNYDPAHWSFLTGPREKLAELAAQSDVKFEPAGGFFNHNFRTLIIDAAGHLQTTFPMGGDLSDAIVSEMVKAAAAADKLPLAAQASQP